MNFTKEELNILKTLASIECEVSKHNLENLGKHFLKMFYDTGNIICYMFYNEARMKWIGLSLLKECLKGIKIG